MYPVSTKGHWWHLHEPPSETVVDASRIHFVRVRTDDRTQQLWAAAAARNEAVDRVLDAIPEGWTARLLLDEQLEPPPDAVSNMVPGEVRKLCDTKDWSDLN
jgi:hypothetical protein